jgi:hypothetical protein
MVRIPDSGPAQPASEGAGILRPARPGPSGHSIGANIDAELQKVGCASRPAMSSRTWAATGSASIMFSIASLVVISGFKATRRSRCVLAGCGPERESAMRGNCRRRQAAAGRRRDPDRHRVTLATARPGRGCNQTNQLRRVSLSLLSVCGTCYLLHRGNMCSSLPRVCINGSVHAWSVEAPKR